MRITIDDALVDELKGESGDSGQEFIIKLLKEILVRKRHQARLKQLHTALRDDRTALGLETQGLPPGAEE